MLKFFIISLMLFIIVNGNKFVATTKLYNGAIGYNGLYWACSNEFPSSEPCDSYNLLHGNFWKYVIPASWYLSTKCNCLGYSSNGSYVAGHCMASLPGNFTYATTCTCEMYIPICCYIKK